MRIVTGSLRPIPADYLPILAGIQIAQLRREGATLPLAYRSMMYPKHLLHQLTVGPPQPWNRDYDLVIQL